MIIVVDGLYLDKAGNWFHDGDAVRHRRLEALLHRSVARDESGALVVTTGRDVLPFVCEDTPRFVYALRGTTVLLRGGESRIEAHQDFTIDDAGVVRSRLGSFWCRWLRSAYHVLIGNAETDLDRGALVVVVGHTRLRICPTTRKTWRDESPSTGASPR